MSKRNKALADVATEPVVVEASEAAVEVADAAPSVTEPVDVASVVGDRVKVRVLVSCGHGRPNDVVEIDQKLLPSLVGVVDASPEAVEYAESLRK